MEKRKRLVLKYPVLVEGKYDRIRLSNIVEMCIRDRVKTVFTGYDELSCGCEIRTILADDESVSILAGGRAVLVLDRTPFYAEGGGQVGDSGETVSYTHLDVYKRQL